MTLIKIRHCHAFANKYFTAFANKYFEKSLQKLSKSEKL